MFQNFLRLIFIKIVFVFEMTFFFLSCHYLQDFFFFLPESSSICQHCNFSQVFLTFLSPGFLICRNRDNSTYLIELSRRFNEILFLKFSIKTFFPTLFSFSVDVNCLFSQLISQRTSTKNPPLTFPGRKNFTEAGKSDACCSVHQQKSTSYLSQSIQLLCLMN